VHRQQRLFVNHSLHWERLFPVYSDLVQCQQSQRQMWWNSSHDVTLQTVL